MSPRRSRTQDKYSPWAQSEPDPAPAPRSRAEAIKQAATWAQWEAAQPVLTQDNWSAPIPPLPWALDWQRNPAAPPPPGFVMARCLDTVWLLRPPDWRSRAYRHGRVQEVGSAVTVGDRCEQCRAPYQRIEHRDDPYVPPEGYALTRCLCHLELHRVHYDPWTPPPEPCERCGAPHQVVTDSGAGYVLELELGEQPGWQQFWRELDRESWAVGDLE